jgi:5'-methylthioadenosine phosphorylase
LEKIRIAVIGGTGFEQIVKNTQQTQIDTPYGLVNSLSFGEIASKRIIFLPRHGAGHSIPPHEVNCRANVYALHMAGVERIIALSAVGAINHVFGPSKIVLPHDFVDFTEMRASTL